MVEKKELAAARLVLSEAPYECSPQGGRFMAQHRVCPWWIGYMLASPVRKLWQNPGRILEPFVQPGMHVLEPGPGMGFFTLELARLVGPRGRVVAVDVEPKMIAGLRRRADRAGLSDRIEARVSPATTMALDRQEFDLVVAFAVVHEMPSAATFFAEAARAMKPGAKLLLLSPPATSGGKSLTASWPSARRTASPSPKGPRPLAASAPC
jgi:SAM-dependent methyltransferase